MNEKRGSIWKKWDLHVHTPFSMYQKYGNSLEDQTWENFICDLEKLPPEFKVIGINDYIFIDGFKKVLEYKEKKGRLKNIELILPVIEFRLKKFVGNEKFRKINYHILFSNEIKVEVLEQQFLTQLYGKHELSYDISEKKISWKGAITRDSLPDLGKAIRQSVPETERAKFTESDLELGFNNINFDEKNLEDILKESQYLDGKYLTAIGKAEWDQFRWSDTGIADKKDLINKVDLVFISAGNISSFIKAKERLREDNVNNRLLDCSDAHNFSQSSDKDRIGKCFTWIKADTTFEGLRQVLVNFEERVFVGEKPKILERVANNKTKYISSILINKKTGSTLSEKWFEDVTVDLNHELVAIIGNKGNGKSALTDIIGLIGCSKTYKDFSFLNPHKFLDPKDNKGSNFWGRILWESGLPEEKSLADSPGIFEAEKVKYIPQLFLEQICNEGDYFERELKEVIFSHVPGSQKLEMDNLDDLINLHSRTINQNIEILLSELQDINKNIVRLEDLGSEQNKQILNDKLRIKKLELETHDKSKPAEIKKPDSVADLTRQASIIKQIDEKKAIKIELEKKIEAYNSEKNTLRVKLALYEKIIGEFQNFQISATSFKKKILSDLTKLGISFDEIFTLKIVLTKLTQGKDEIVRRLEEIKRDLDPNGVFDKQKNKIIDNAYSRLSKISKEIDSLNNELDGPSQKYQLYLKRLNEWEKKRNEIIGEKSQDGTLKYYEHLIEYISSNLPGDLTLKKQERMTKSLEIYRKKKELIEVYKELYRPVEDFITKYRLSEAKYQVQLDVTLKVENFVARFFEFVHQGVKGSFYGLEEGKQKLKSILDRVDFNNETLVTEFIDSILHHLDFDLRGGAKEAKNVRQQLKTLSFEDELTAFYDFLFCFDYLNPIFQLKLADRELSQLTPGEKGVLLLIFYLLIDKNDIPLVIDQPEENLDNQSVYELLVPFIKDAKQRRQIIIVTHNPNLAVVCDAEQIIYAKIDKPNQFQVSYLTGAIENPLINRAITDVLEGTLPAFDIRDYNYRITRLLP